MYFALADRLILKIIACEILSCNFMNFDEHMKNLVLNEESIITLLVYEGDTNTIQGTDGNSTVNTTMSTPTSNTMSTRSNTIQNIKRTPKRTKFVPNLAFTPLVSNSICSITECPHHASPSIHPIESPSIHPIESPSIHPIESPHIPCDLSDVISSSETVDSVSNIQDKPIGVLVISTSQFIYGICELVFIATRIKKKGIGRFILGHFIHKVLWGIGIYEIVTYASAESIEFFRKNRFIDLTVNNGYSWLYKKTRGVIYSKGCRPMIFRCANHPYISKVLLTRKKRKDHFNVYETKALKLLDESGSYHTVDVVDIGSNGMVKIHYRRRNRQCREWVSCQSIRFAVNLCAKKIRK